MHVPKNKNKTKMFASSVPVSSGLEVLKIYNYIDMKVVLRYILEAIKLKISDLEVVICLI